MSSVFKALTWLSLLCALIAGLHFVGTIGYGFDALRGVETSADVVVAAIAVVRAAALLVTLYLLGCALLEYAAAVTKLQKVDVVVRSVALPSVRRINRQIVGLSLAGALAFPAVPATAQTSFDSGVIEVPVLRHEGAVASVTTAPAPKTTTVPAPVSRIAKSPVESKAATHTIATGESLWSIAEATLSAHGVTATEADVARYWAQLIEHNRQVLPSPDNPDFVFPGLVLELPPL